MTEEETKKAELMHTRLLNQVGLCRLAKLGIYKKLILSLEIGDLEKLIANNIYFYPFFSPSSQSVLQVGLPKGATIIGIDINSLSRFSSEEGVAIILHEIGHSLNPSLKGEEGEYAADDYAVCRGYKDYIISGLENGKVLYPTEFDKEITNKRISRLQA
jgi:hypothetical protein